MIIEGGDDDSRYSYQFRRVGAMKCPYCSEDIKDEAVICRYCRSPLFYPKPLMDDIKSIKDQIQHLSELLLDADRRAALSNVSLPPITERQSIFFRPILKMILGNIVILCLLFVPSLGFLNFWLIAILLVMSLGAWVGHPLKTPRSLRFLSYSLFNGVMFLIASELRYLIRFGPGTDPLGDIWLNRRFFTLAFLSATLAFATGGLIDHLFRALIGVRSQTDAMNYRMSASLLPERVSRSGHDLVAPARQLDILVALLPPFFALIGTIATAYFGFLAAAAKLRLSH